MWSTCRRRGSVRVTWFSEPLGKVSSAPLTAVVAGTARPADTHSNVVEMLILSTTPFPVEVKMQAADVQYMFPTCNLRTPKRQPR